MSKLELEKMADVLMAYGIGHEDSWDGDKDDKMRIVAMLRLVARECWEVTLECPSHGCGCMEKIEQRFGPFEDSQ